MLNRRLEDIFKL